MTRTRLKSKLNLLTLFNGEFWFLDEKMHIADKVIHQDENKAKEMERSNTVNSQDFFNFLDKTAIDAVVNCAGFTGKPNVDECEVRKEECFIQNSILPRDIEEVCKLKRVNLIHVSSGCIYTGYDKDYTEEDEPNFGMFDSDSSFYSKSKHAGELNLDTNFTNIIRIRI